MVICVWLFMHYTMAPLEHLSSNKKSGDLNPSKILKNLHEVNL